MEWGDIENRMVKVGLLKQHGKRRYTSDVATAQCENYEGDQSYEETNRPKTAAIRQKLHSRFGKNAH